MYALTKTYSLDENEYGPRGTAVVKQANKGVQMELKDFLALMNNQAYTYKRDAPSYKKDGSATFITRTLKGIPT
jgi:hypothetical protein